MTQRARLLTHAREIPTPKFRLMVAMFERRIARH